MPKNKLYIKIFVVLLIPIVALIVLSKPEDETKSNRQNIQEKNNKQEEKIALQLDSALNLVNKNNAKALDLSMTCLLESQEIKNKSLQMRSFYALGMAHRDSVKSSQKYFDKALLLSKDIEDKWYRGEILCRKGINQYRANETNLAIETFNEALKYGQLSGNFKIIGTTYSMIGNIFRFNGIYSKAIEYFIKARLNYNKADFNEGDVWVTYLLGMVHSDMRNSEKAMQYFQESLDKYRVMAAIDNDKTGLALCYEQIAKLHMEFGNFEKGREVINLLLEIYTSNKSEYGLSIAYRLLGELEYLKGNYSKAESHLNKSLKIKNRYLNFQGKSSVYKHLGLCLVEKGNFDAGIEKIKQGLEIALSTKSKKNQLAIYSKLADIYLENNDFEKAIYYEKRQIEVHEVILYGEADIKVEQLQTFYEIDKKNRQINELQKENEVNALKIKQQRFHKNLMVFVVLIVIVIALFVYVYYRKLRQKNNELKILNSTTNKLFSIIAHDLRSPFNTIVGFSDLLSVDAENLKTKDVVKYGENINRAALNTLALLENLLSWAKSQTGQVTFNPEKLYLQSIIAKTIEMFYATAELKNIKLNYIQTADIAVYADHNMLKTILRNLISNAIKFTRLNGTITIKAQQKDSFIEVEISDNGVGMNSEVINTLFTAQTHQTTLGTANEGGSGLGLSLCKELVEKHGGCIWVVSEPYQGATFHFTLPGYK